MLHLLRAKNGVPYGLSPSLMIPNKYAVVNKDKNLVSVKRERRWGALKTVRDGQKEKITISCSLCTRHEEEIAHELVVWESVRGQRSRRRGAVTYLDNLKEDNNLKNAVEMRKMMFVREEWNSPS